VLGAGVRGRRRRRRGWSRCRRLFSRRREQVAHWGRSGAAFSLRIVRLAVGEGIVNDLRPMLKNDFRNLFIFTIIYCFGALPFRQEAELITPTFTKTSNG